MKILLWFDFDCYTYINLGVGKELANNNNTEFIGVVATKPDYEFLKQGTVLDMDELWYYPDSYNHPKEYDPVLLGVMAKKYNLSTWVQLYGERSFYKYWTQFHRFLNDEILSILYHSILFFERILDGSKPDLVITQQVGENLANIVLYHICKAKHIKILMPNQVYIHDRIIISDNPLSMEIADDFRNVDYNFLDHSKTYDLSYIKSRDRAASVRTLLDATLPRISFQKRVSRFFDDISHTYKDVDRSKTKRIKHKIKIGRAIKKREKFIEQNLLKDVDLDASFYYYPLTTEPEARILATSPFYMNQIVNIENIAKSIPLDSLLYVKEHPLQKLKNWRHDMYYKAIMQMPNVRLIHPDYDSHKLLNNCKGVISISGGTAFEALFYKKPVILFGDEYYDTLSMVDKVNDIRLLPRLIQGMDQKQFNQAELDTFMAIFEKNTITIPYHTMINEASALSVLNRYNRNWQQTTRKFNEYFYRHSGSFFMMAKCFMDRATIDPLQIHSKA